MFALAASMLDLVWESAADVETNGRFRDEHGLDEGSYLDYRRQLARSLFGVLRATVEASRPGLPAGASFEPLQAEVARQCDLMWCASLDAHRSPDFRLADGRLDDELHRTFRHNVREVGAAAILNARPAHTI